MSRSDAYIVVTCDNCKEQSMEIQLTAVAGGWDDRGLDRKIEREGWKTGREGDICDECKGD